MAMQTRVLLATEEGLVKLADERRTLVVTAAERGFAEAVQPVLAAIGHNGPVTFKYVDVAGVSRLVALYEQDEPATP